VTNSVTDINQHYFRCVDQKGTQFYVKYKDFILMSEYTRFAFMRTSTFTTLHISNLYRCSSYFIYSKDKLDFPIFQGKSNPLFTISFHANVPNYHPVLVYLLKHDLADIVGADIIIGKEHYSLFDFFIYSDF